MEPWVLAARFVARARTRTRQAIPRSKLRLDTELGRVAHEGEDRRHAQLECHGNRSDRDDCKHRRRVAIDRTDLPEPLRQIEPVGRIHRREPVHGSRSESAGSVGQGHGQRPQVLRRQPARDRPGSRHAEATLCNRVRSRATLARRCRCAPAEMDRSGAVAESVHRRRIGQETRRDVPDGVDPRLEDDVLPARAQRHEHREVDGRSWPAQCGLGRPASRSVNAAETTEAGPACSIANPDCEACQ